MATLYLTADEKKNLFAKLPAKVRSAWEGSVADETLTEYFESEDQLVKQLQAASDKPSSALRKFIKASADTKDGLPEFDAPTVEALADAVGAAGMSAVLVAALTSGDVAEDDLDGVASLSEIRHRILVANSAA